MLNCARHASMPTCGNNGYALYPLYKCTIKLHINMGVHKYMDIFIAYVSPSYQNTISWSTQFTDVGFFLLLLIFFLPFSDLLSFLLACDTVVFYPAFGSCTIEFHTIPQLNHNDNLLTEPVPYMYMGHTVITT